MCGITGYINKQISIPDTSTIIKMLQIQKHRGPNDSGIQALNFLNGSIKEVPVNRPIRLDDEFDALIGFNRLSILDLSDNGHQPMLNSEQNVILVMNGEIYNAFDLKPGLEKNGYLFKSTTDTEVVLALYLKVGFRKMICQLNGMFAIAIADLRTGEFHIARDRFGIKPLYYLNNQKILAFSSEIKSFLYLEDFHARLNQARLDEYLLFRNTIEESLFKEIQTLPPGTMFTYNHRAGISLTKFFDINDFNRSQVSRYDISYYQKNIELLIANSVESQLMSDVKLGCQLSGGVDSSIVTWYANKRARRGNFESVSIIFNDQNYNEEEYIDKVTGKLGITTHKFLLTSQYFLDNLENATWHFETPINHPNTIGIFLLSQRAKEHVTVLLSGEGADEVFGGYSRFYDASFPLINKKFFTKIIRSIKGPNELATYLNPTTRSVLSSSFMLPETAKKLYSSFSLNDAISHRCMLYDNLVGSSFDRQVKYEIITYLPDLLIRQDKMSMAHSIENRVPFLDNYVVAGSFDIPEKFLVKPLFFSDKSSGKFLLKEMASQLFDKDFAYRRKMGFSIPLREYFSEKRFNEYLHDKILPGIKRRGIIDHKLIQKWLKSIPIISSYEIESLWISITFEIWATAFLDFKK